MVTYVLLVFIILCSRRFTNRCDNNTWEDCRALQICVETGRDSSKCLTRARDEISDVIYKVLDFKLILAYGSLLGYTRTGQGIEGDDDVDFMVWGADFSSVYACLQSTGFKPRYLNDHFFLIDDPPYPQIDFYRITLVEPGLVCEHWEHNWILETDLVPTKTVLNKSFVIPNRPEILLQQWYGEDWKTPQSKKGENFPKHPYC